MPRDVLYDDGRDFNDSPQGDHEPIKDHYVNRPSTLMPVKCRGASICDRLNVFGLVQVGLITALLIMNLPKLL